MYDCASFIIDVKPNQSHTFIRHITYFLQKHFKSCWTFIGVNNKKGYIPEFCRHSLIRDRDTLGLYKKTYFYFREAKINPNRRPTNQFNTGHCFWVQGHSHIRKSKQQ